MFRTHDTVRRTGIWLAPDLRQEEEITRQKSARTVADVSLFLLSQTFFFLLATALDIRERNGLTFRINQPMRQKCQKKGYRVPLRACWFVRSVDHVLHSADDGDDEVRRHEYILR